MRTDPIEPYKGFRASSPEPSHFVDKRDFVDFGSHILSPWKVCTPTRSTLLFPSLNSRRHEWGSRDSATLNTDSVGLFPRRP